MFVKKEHYDGYHDLKFVKTSIINMVVQIEISKMGKRI